jgi:hypothetical protein
MELNSTAAVGDKLGPPCAYTPIQQQQCQPINMKQQQKLLLCDNLLDTSCKHLHVEVV